MCISKWKVQKKSVRSTKGNYYTGGLQTTILCLYWKEHGLVTCTLLTSLTQLYQEEELPWDFKIHFDCMVWACPISMSAKVSVSHFCPPQATAWEGISHRRVEGRKVRYLKDGCLYLYQLHLASFSTNGQKGSPTENSSSHSKADGWGRSNKVPSGDTCVPYVHGGV